MKLQEPAFASQVIPGEECTNPLRVGLIGVANFGEYRRERLRETGLFDLAVCYDLNARALQLACGKENARAAESIECLLAEPGLEAVVISTGIDTHASYAIQAMERGLHVFVEKPLCGLMTEARQLLEARNATGCIFGSGHRDDLSAPIYLLIRKVLEDGLLGTLVCYEKNSSHSGGLEIQPGDWRGLPDRNPGGMLIQCGVHSLALIQNLFGTVQSVAAMMRMDAYSGTQTADAANVLLKHESGLIGTLNCYHVTAYMHEFRLFGTKGNLYIDTQENQNRAWFQERRRTAFEERVEIDFPASPPFAECNNLITWYRAIRFGDSSPRPSLEDAIHAVLPVFAAEKSDREGRTVSLSEFGFF